MSWAEASPGLYQRPLGGAERGYVALIAGERAFARELIKVHAFADITAQHGSEETIQAFRDGWKALRLLKSPDIATMFKGPNTQYQVPSDQELEQWLNRTFVVAPLGSTTEDVVREMQLRLEYLPVFYIIPRSTSNERFSGSIILFISHWRAEASGCYQMLSQLCDYADDLITGTTTRAALLNHLLGDETKLLTPTLEEIVMPNQEPSSESKARMEAHFDNYYSQLPCIELAMQADVSTPFSNVLLNRHTYSSTATSRVVASCKSHGVTVTAAVHAAYIGAVWDRLDADKQGRSYASLMPAQARPRLPASSPYKTHGCWNAALPMMLTVPAGLDFRQRTDSLAQQYSIAGQRQWWFQDTRAVIEQSELMPAKSPPNALATPWFTSLGILDRELIPVDHGSIHVDNVWGWADPMGPGCVLTMWTYQGRLNVQITWNATYHSDQLITAILDSVNTTLAKELNVETGLPEVTRAEY